MNENAYSAQLQQITELLIEIRDLLKEKSPESEPPMEEDKSTTDILSLVKDLIPNPNYNPWYVKHLKRLGEERFMETAEKARAGSDTPAILFKWMLENNGIVK